MITLFQWYSFNLSVKSIFPAEFCDDQSECLNGGVCVEELERCNCTGTGYNGTYCTTEGKFNRENDRW